MAKTISLVFLLATMLFSEVAFAQQTPDETMMTAAQNQDMLQTSQQMKGQMQNMMNSCQQMMGDMMQMMPMMMQMHGYRMTRGGKMEDMMGGVMIGSGMGSWTGGVGSVLWTIIMIGLAVLIWLWIIKLWRELLQKKR
jgi:hypothetical protein